MTSFSNLEAMEPSRGVRTLTRYTYTPRANCPSKSSRPFQLMLFWWGPLPSTEACNVRTRVPSKASWVTCTASIFPSSALHSSCKDQGLHEVQVTFRCRGLGYASEAVQKVALHVSDFGFSERSSRLRFGLTVGLVQEGVALGFGMR